MSDLSDHWPMYKLRLRHDGLELRFPRDQDLAALANLAAGRIHEVAMMPFSTPWTDATPAVRARSSLQWHWKLRADWSPHDWTLALVAADDGVIVGTQDISGRRFGATREVSTGSWVGADHQGRGVATAMRRAVLHLASPAWARAGPEAALISTTPPVCESRRSWATSRTGPRCTRRERYRPRCNDSC
jgi:RimJ/RimL family protein N-acetyltransferase